MRTHQQRDIGRGSRSAVNHGSVDDARAAEREITRLQGTAGNAAVASLIVAQRDPQQHDVRQTVSAEHYGPASIGEAQRQISQQAATSALNIYTGAVKTADAVSSYAQQKGGKDEAALETARHAQQLVSALMQLAEGLKSTADKFLDASRSWTSDEESAVRKGWGWVGDIINALRLLDAGADADVKQREFARSPSAETASAWADSVSDVFDKLGDSISVVTGNLGPLGFIGDYYAGLLKAPKAYVAAFKSAMKLHYGPINEVIGTGGPGSSLPGIWQGEITQSVVLAAYFEAHSDGSLVHGMYDWLLALPSAQKELVQKLPKDWAINKLIGLVYMAHRDGQLGDQYLDWINWLEQKKK